MTEKFENPEIPIKNLPHFEEVHFNKVSLQLRTKSLVMLSLVFIALLILAGFYFYNIAVNWINAFVVGILLLFFIIRYIDIFLKQAYYGYAVRDKDILYRHGYIVKKTTVITFNRIQHVGISRSFFDKLFGIASLKIYTAGGSGSDIDIPGLLPDLAKDLQDTLSKKVSIL